MKVFHIIPSFYDYFSDITEIAFSLVDAVNSLGVETKPITVQYGPPSKSEIYTIREAAPNIKPVYMGESKFQQVVNEFADYDIVHLHCPFFGAASRLLKWKRENQHQPFVVTYYRDVVFTDMFSLIPRWYNNYYLPKIFQAADAVSCFSEDDFNRSLGAKFLQDKLKLIELGGRLSITHLTDNTNEVKLLNKDAMVDTLLAIYEELLNH